MAHFRNMTPGDPSRTWLKAFPFKSIAILGVSLAAIGSTALGAKAQSAIGTISCTSILTGTGSEGGPVFESNCPSEATLGDKKVSNFFSDPTSGDFNITFDYTWLDPDGVADANYGDDVWTFKLTTNTPISGAFGPFTYGYNVDILDPNWEFNLLGIDTDVAFPLTLSTVVKTAQAGGETVLTLTSVDGARVGDVFDGSYKSVVIRDTITLLPNPVVEITSVTNAWTQRPHISSVPGPLPILGAGAAFGMSRRLRRRIKTSAAA